MQLALIFDILQRRQDLILRISLARSLLSSPKGPLLRPSFCEAYSGDGWLAASLNSVWRTKVCSHVTVLRDGELLEVLVLLELDCWFALAKIS